MRLNTMAAVMSYVSKIEHDAASFYETYGHTYPELKDTFVAWAKENRKFEKNIKRTYFGVITDTLESNFAFEGLDTDDYAIEALLSERKQTPQPTKRAQEIEETIKNFYLTAAQLSEGLMADIPRLFRKIAQTRQQRCLTLDAF